MRITKPRLKPVEPEKVRELQLELFGLTQAHDMNITGLWALHPKLMSAQIDFQKHLLFESELDPRIRELAVLRVGWLCQSGYELAQHAVIGKMEGLSNADLARIKIGPDSDEWTPLEAAAIRAVDEMVADACISDETWDVLSANLNEKELLDLLSVVGRYWAVSVILNSTGIQLESHSISFDEQIKSTADVTLKKLK
jgi:alkylhydroperoxidase family enzyme